MGTQLPPEKKAHHPYPLFGLCLLWPRLPISATAELFYCTQTAGWIKMALGMEIGLGPGDFVFDGDQATPRTEGTSTTTQFLANIYCGQTAGWTKTPLGT